MKIYIALRYKANQIFKPYDIFEQRIKLVNWKEIQTFPMVTELEKSSSAGSISQSHLLGRGGGTGFGSKWLPFWPCTLKQRIRAHKTK